MTNIFLKQIGAESKRAYFFFYASRELNDFFPSKEEDSKRIIFSPLACLSLTAQADLRFFLQESRTSHDFFEMKRADFDIHLPTLYKTDA